MEKNISPELLTWYDKYARILPWRIPPEKSKNGVLPDPYHVWLSEVMLQQTTVKAVVDYFQKFKEKWPTIVDLASDNVDAVMTAWAGLGYYSRARNLHKCAQYIVNEYNGYFPVDAKELKKLPGIGDYTSAAISAIAFNQHAAVMDGNIERVISRLYRISDPLPASKPIIFEKVAALTPTKRAGDYAQAMMDIGATICTPRNPVCALCPLKAHCDAFHIGDMTLYPQKIKKKKVPHRHGVAVIFVNHKNEILIQKREPKGLFGGLYVFPYKDDLSSKFSVEKHVDKKDMHRIIHRTDHCILYKNKHKNTSDYIINNIVDKSVIKTTDEINNKYYLCGQVKHIFTHFSLDLDIVFLPVSDLNLLNNERWVALHDIESYALPSLMTKVLKQIRSLFPELHCA